MGYANKFASQSRFYASYGLSCKVMSACEPFGDFGLSLVEQSGKILLGESLGFQNFSDTLGNFEWQIKFGFLLGGYRSEAITE